MTETQAAIADALSEAADELEVMADEHIGHDQPDAVAPQEQIKQLRRDAYYLRRKAVALRA